MLNFGFSLGRPSGTPPLLQGDYIWYSLDPDTGFLNNGGLRYINDEGNTIMVGALGQYDGMMHSGRSVTVSGDGVIPVPINYDGSTVQGSVTFFNASTGAFEQVTSLPLAPTYALKDGTYGTIIKLHTAQFSQDDLDFFNEVPERALQWYWGEIAVPSGLVKGSDDKCYYPTDGYYLELDYNEGSELLTDTAYAEDAFGSSSTISGNLIDGFTLTETQETDGSNIQFPRCYVEGTYAPTTGDFFRYTNTFYSVSGTDYIRGFRINRNPESNCVPSIVELPSTKTVFFNASSDYADGNSYLEPNNIMGEQLVFHFNTSLHKILSEYIPIEGTYTYNTRTASGLQTMRLELNAAGVPTKVLTNHQICFIGKCDHVDTGVAVDGSKTDFTAMIAWVQVDTGREQIIASSGGTDTTDNKFELRINSDETVSAVLGKNVFDMTPMLDPTSPVHAMCAVYNKDTMEIKGAVDGGTLTSMGTITFDGPSGVVWLGRGKDESACFGGYIGEGILSASQESQNAFDAFWERVNNNYCPQPEGELFQNRNFDCGAAYWDLDPNYGGNIIDNGDGTVTLEATENFSSLTQLDKFPIPAGNYHMGVSVSAISGNGKYSYKLADGTWVDAFIFTTPGTHQTDVSVSQEIIAIDIGADDDATAVITFDGAACIDNDFVPMPDWWEIGSLSPTNILGVWDFAWTGHGSQGDALTTLAGSMANMVTETGSPTWNGADQGMNFGGAGAIASLLPDGLDMRDLSVIIEIHSVTQNNASLDALYSHYLNDTNGHYTLQTGWNIGKLRWSCGDAGSGTIEEGSIVTAGVIATCGRDLYSDGTLLGTVPDSAATATSNQKFVLGCIKAPDNAQFSKMKVKKLLIVDRVLTEAEVQEITGNITSGASIDTSDMDGDGNPDTVLFQSGNVTITEDSDSINIDIDGDGIADLEIPK